MSAVLTVARVAPFHPSFTITILVLALNLDVLTDAWHLTFPPTEGPSPQGSVQSLCTTDASDTVLVHPKLRNLAAKIVASTAQSASAQRRTADQYSNAAAHERP